MKRKKMQPKNNIMKCVSIILITLLVGIGLGRYLVPNSTKTTTEDSKETERSRETTDRTTTNPDGSKTVEHIVKDERKTKEEHNTTVTVDNKKPDWKASVIAGYNLDNKNRVYGIHVERRILGAVFLGAYGDTAQTLGLSVGYEF